jgi:hypothetical protein
VFLGEVGSKTPQKTFQPTIDVEFQTHRPEKKNFSSIFFINFKGSSKTAQKVAQNRKEPWYFFGPVSEEPTTTTTTTSRSVLFLRGP